MSESIDFFLTGPTHVRRDVLETLSRPVVGHRSQAFAELYASLAPRLRRVVRTAGDVLLATSSSTLVMESAVRSTVSGAVLNLTCGAFSERWHQISDLVGVEADRVSVPWGRAVEPELVREALRRKRYDAVTVVHNETSTGVMNPIEEIAKTVRAESDALLLVDAVSSLGGAPVETDAWGIDVVLAGVQKALALPPGLTVFTFSDRAAERAAAVPHRGFYTDLARYRDKHRAGGTITTPAVSLVYALDRQLDVILEEGVEARWERHRELMLHTAAWAERNGFEHVAAPECRSWTVSCLKPPAGVEPARLRAGLARRGFTVAGGYGDWKPTTFRIGHMGEVRGADLDRLFAAIDEVVAEERAAVAAAAGPER